MAVGATAHLHRTRASSDQTKDMLSTKVLQNAVAGPDQPSESAEWLLPALVVFVTNNIFN